MANKPTMDSKTYEKQSIKNELKSINRRDVLTVHKVVALETINDTGIFHVFYTE
jgi:hypothetical protein